MEGQVGRQIFSDFFSDRLFSDRICHTSFVGWGSWMGRGFSNDQLDQVLGQLFSGVAVFFAEICEW
jgi:hypothetical protein